MWCREVVWSFLELPRIIIKGKEVNTVKASAHPRWVGRLCLVVSPTQVRDSRLKETVSSWKDQSCRWDQAKILIKTFLIHDARNQLEIQPKIKESQLYFEKLVQIFVYFRVEAVWPHFTLAWQRADQVGTARPLHRALIPCPHCSRNRIASRPAAVVEAPVTWPRTSVWSKHFPFRTHEIWPVRKTFDIFFFISIDVSDYLPAAWFWFEILKLPRYQRTLQTNA